MENKFPIIFNPVFRLLTMIAKKQLQIIIGVTCFSLTSCAFLIDSMIYSKKTQTCALVNNWGDTLSVYTECGGFYDRAEQDCKVAAYDYNNCYDAITDYTCCCTTTKDEE